MGDPDTGLLMSINDELLIDNNFATTKQSDN